MMKEAELRDHATCLLCRKKIGTSGLPLFWLVTSERYGLEDMARQLMSIKITACETCGRDRNLPIAVLAELLATDDEAPETDPDFEIDEEAP